MSFMDPRSSLASVHSPLLGSVTLTLTHDFLPGNRWSREGDLRACSSECEVLPLCAESGQPRRAVPQSTSIPDSQVHHTRASCFWEETWLLAYMQRVWLWGWEMAPHLLVPGVIWHNVSPSREHRFHSTWHPVGAFFFSSTQGLYLT